MASQIMKAIALPRLGAWLALAFFLIALLLANLGVPEYSHLLHPVALRGATGLPGALWFNLGAFVLPGGLLLLQAQVLRKAMQKASWLARIGLTLAQLSALAFALQGVLPLDQQGVDAAASRLHVLMWMLWWIAFVPGALLLALALRQRRGLMWLSVLAAVGGPLLAVLAPVGAWAGLAQRLAFALWFGWWLYASVSLSRTSTSGAGSLPPGQR
mgnify:CR=1 FL=1